MRMSEYRLMRFTRIVLYRAGSCKVCMPPLTNMISAIAAGNDKTVKPTIDRLMMIAHQQLENKYAITTSFLAPQLLVFAIVSRLIHPNNRIFTKVNQVIPDITTTGNAVMTALKIINFPAGRQID